MTNPDLVLLIAWLLLTAVFLQSAYDKFRFVPQEMEAMRSLHLPVPGPLLRLTGTCELVGSAMLLFGPGVRTAAVLLGLFTIGVSFAFLRFWTLDAKGAAYGAQRDTFFGNLSLVGGLLYVAVIGPGTLVLFDWGY